MYSCPSRDTLAVAAYFLSSLLGYPSYIVAVQFLSVDSVGDTLPVNPSTRHLFNALSTIG